MNTTAIILCLIGVAVAIVLSYKFNINMGVTALAFALSIGILAMGMRAKDVVALWPVSTMFQIMCVSLFFGFAIENGTMQAMADHILYRLGKRSWLLGFVLFFIAFLLGAIGCNPIIITVIVGLFSFNLAVPSGLHPMVGAFATAQGGLLGNIVSWGAVGIIVFPTIASNGYEEQANSLGWGLWGIFAVTAILGMIILYIIFKAHKVRPIDIDKPAPLSKLHKQSLVIIAVVVIAAIVPAILGLFIKAPWVSVLSKLCDIQNLSMLGFIVNSLLKLADGKKVIKSVPWNTIIVVGGIGVLMSLATQAGAMDVIAAWLTDALPGWLMPAFLSLLAGFLSFFSSGMTTVFPMLSPMVAGLCAASGANPLVLFSAICIGAAYTAVSPFSTGGALYLSACHDEKLSTGLVGQLLGLAFCSMVYGAIVTTLIGLIL